MVRITSLIATILFAFLASCGGAKFSGNSGKEAGGKTEQPFDQPTDVAGGFGLTCLSADNPADPTKSDYSCAFSNGDGFIFQERPDLKLTVKVSIASDVLDVVMQPTGSTSNFVFTVEKTKAMDVQIRTQFINQGRVSPEVTGFLKHYVAPKIEKQSQPFISPFSTGISRGVSEDKGVKEFRYTMDGSAPTCASGIQLPITGAIIQIVRAMTLKVISCDDTGVASPVAVATYPLRQCDTLCGDGGNGCYDNQAAIFNQCAILADGKEASSAATIIDYAKADSTCSQECFYVWRERNGSRILNSTGLWASLGATAGWQKKLTPNGLGENGDLDVSSIGAKIAGRACPSKTNGSGVFIDYDNMVQSGRCLYFSSMSPVQRINDGSTIPGRIEGTDYLLEGKSDTNLIGRGRMPSYYEGNIKTCRDLGMRLPTIYEIQGEIWASISNAEAQKPNGDGLQVHPKLAGSNGVPYKVLIWTASAHVYASDVSQSQSTNYWSGYVDNTSGAISISYENTYNQRSVRCVLP